MEDERTERRLRALEERTIALQQEVSTHGAVCVERQKTIFNMLAAIQGEIAEVRKALSVLATDVHGRIDTVRTTTSGRLDRWVTAIAGGALVAAGTLAVLIMTHGLKS